MNEKPRIYRFKCLLCDDIAFLVSGNDLALAEGWIACEYCGQPCLLVDPLENAESGERRAITLASCPVYGRADLLPAGIVVRLTDDADTPLGGWSELLESGLRFFIPPTHLRQVKSEPWVAYAIQNDRPYPIKTVAACNASQARYIILRSLYDLKKPDYETISAWRTGGEKVIPLDLFGRLMPI